MWVDATVRLAPRLHIYYTDTHQPTNQPTNNATTHHTQHTNTPTHTDPMDEDFEASTMSDGLLARKPRKRCVNLALSLEDLYKGGTKKLKVGCGYMGV